MMTELPAISLWQPWASLLFVPGAKRHETRHWAAPQRLIGKRVLIHAAKTQQGYRDLGYHLNDLLLEAFGELYPRKLPHGAFIGLATLGRPFLMREGIARYGAVDDNDELCGNWCPGRWAWPLHEPIPFAEPVPGKGQQGWWVAEVDARLLTGG